MSRKTRVWNGTLQEALSSPGVIVPGNRLLLRGGFYHITDIMPCLLSGVTITAYPGETAIVQSENPVNGQCLVLNGVNNVTIDGIVFVGAAGSYTDAIQITGRAHDITLKNLDVGYFAGNGLLCNPPAAYNILIEDCHFHHCGVNNPYTHNIYIECRDVTLRRVESDHASGMGIHLFFGQDDYGNVIENCFCHDNAEMGIGVYYGRHTIVNTISRDNGKAALSIKYNALDTTVQFCTLMGTVYVGEMYKTGAVYLLENNIILGTHGLAVDTLGRNELIVNNCLLHGSSENKSFIPNDTGCTLTNCTERAFEPIDDDGAGQVIPMAGNPAIGAGVPVLGIGRDYGDHPRRVPPTLGAWEG